MSHKAELKKKYDKSRTFRAEMDKVQSNYQLLVQKAIYSTIPASDSNFIRIYEGKSRMECKIYFIDASQQYIKARSIEKLTTALITKIPKPSSNYIIVYINDPQHSNCFSDLKTVLQIMPIEYHLNLVKILLLESTFLQKASRFFVFGTIPKFINAQIDNIDDYEQLAEKLVLDKKQLIAYLPKHQNDIKIQQKKPKSDITPIANQSGQNKRQISKYEIDQYDKAQNGLPQLFQLLVYYFGQHPEGLQEQGIFRKSANIIQQTQTMQSLSNKHYKCLQQIKNPHIVANMIKRFLSDLKTPIIPYQLFYPMMQQQNITPQYLSLKMKQLSSMNLTKILTLMFLIQFLQTSVIVHSHKNKMSSDNLAICFAPCLMWAKERSVKDIAYASKSVKIASVMFKNFQEVFGSPKDQKKLYRQSYYQHKNKSLEPVMLISDNDQEKRELKVNKKMSALSEESDDTEMFQSQKLKQAEYKKLEVKQQKMQESKPRKRGIFTSKLGEQSNTKTIQKQKIQDVKSPK